MKRLKAERIRAGISLRKLSEKSKVDPSYLSKAETGHILSAGQLRRVADALGWEKDKDPSELFEEVPEDERVAV